MLISDAVFDHILGRVVARWTASESRGGLGASLTNELLQRLKRAADEAAGRILTSAEFEYEMELTDFDKDEPGCGAYIRQYMQIEKNGEKNFVGKGMPFETMRQCVSLAAAAGWFGAVGKAIDLDASPVFAIVADMMLEIDNEEIAFLTVQGWKSRKIARLKDLTLSEILCDINITFLKFQRDWAMKEIEQTRRSTNPKFHAIQKIELFGRLFLEDVMDEVREEVRAEARALRRRERREQG